LSKGERDGWGLSLGWPTGQAISTAPRGKKHINMPMAKKKIEATRMSRVVTENRRHRPGARRSISILQNKGPARRGANPTTVHIIGKLISETAAIDTQTLKEKKSRPGNTRAKRPRRLKGKSVKSEWGITRGPSALI